MEMNFIMLQAGNGGDQGMMQLLMIVALIVIFYFFMIRPQQKKQKEIKKFRESLGKGSKIITAGGIHGRIVSDDGDAFIVEVASGVRLKVDKNSIYPAGADTKEVQQEKEELKK